MTTKEEAFDYLETIAKKVTKNTGTYIESRLENLYKLLYISDDIYMMSYEISELMQLLKWYKLEPECVCLDDLFCLEPDPMLLCFANILTYIQGKTFLSQSDRRTILDAIYGSLK